METWSIDNMCRSIKAYFVTDAGLFNMDAWGALAAMLFTACMTAYNKRALIEKVWHRIHSAVLSNFIKARQSIELIYSMRGPNWIKQKSETEGPLWPVWDNEQLRASSRILVVDDANIAQIPQIERLRDRGFNVIHLKSMGKISSGLEKEYDLLILDVRGVIDKFGNTDGLAVLEMVRADNPWIPIVVWSSFVADINTERRADVEKLCQCILEKHIKFVELEVIILDLLGKTRTHQYFMELYNIKTTRNVPADSQKEVISAVTGGDFFSPQELTRRKRIQAIEQTIKDDTRWRKQS